MYTLLCLNIIYIYMHIDNNAYRQVNDISYTKSGEAMWKCFEVTGCSLQSCVVVFGSGAKFKTINKRTNFPILREMWNEIQCSVKTMKGRKTKVRMKKKRQQVKSLVQWLWMLAPLYQKCPSTKQVLQMNIWTMLNLYRHSM